MKMYASFESDVIVHRIKNTFKDALKQKFQDKWIQSSVGKP